ncbi:MAG: hypothetical protein J5563_01050 [Clostridia bacterium]|nr:hypothetical protein [Clostridia bacterium]
MKKLLSILLTVLLVVSCMTLFSSAYSDSSNGDWSQKSVILKNTSEAELVVRVGDIDACNDESAVSGNGYDPFTAKSQYAHGYPWQKDETDPAGTDRIFVGSKWKGESTDGYSSNYSEFKSGNDTENAYGEGALTLIMEYDAPEITVKNVILQLCIDDFQANSWESNFTVTLNGKDAPFIAELLNHTDQTGPTAYIVSAIIPSGFFEDIATGKLAIVIDETTGVGDGYAIDFAKLLINYNDKVFTGKFTGTTEPGATVRLLGTSTTVTASSTGGFTFNAIPGINAVRASKNGFVENYDSGIVLSSGTEWEAAVPLEEGKGNPDIDFSKFGVASGEENNNGNSSAPASDGSGKDNPYDDGNPSGVGSKCPICHFCPQPLGLCIFIWLLIILVAIIIVVIIIVASKRKKKDEKK